MHDPEQPAAHVLVVEVTPGEAGSLAASVTDARRRTILRMALFGIPLVIFFPFVLTNAVEEVGLLPLLAAVVFIVGLAVPKMRQNRSLQRQARNGVWSKFFRKMVVAEHGVSSTLADVYLVLRETGIVIQQQKPVQGSRGRLSFDTVRSLSWESITTIEFTRGRNRWLGVILSGPGIKVAPVGSVPSGVGDVLASLGARVPTATTR